MSGLDNPYSAFRHLFVSYFPVPLKGLGQLLIGAPRLMLLADKHGVVGAALAKGAGDEVLVQALR